MFRKDSVIFFLCFIDFHTPDARCMPHLRVVCTEMLIFSPQHHYSLYTLSSIVKICFRNCCLHGKQTRGVQGALRIRCSRESGVIFKGSLFCRQKITASVTTGVSSRVGRWIGQMLGQNQVSWSNPRFKIRNRWPWGQREPNSKVKLKTGRRQKSNRSCKISILFSVWQLLSWTEIKLGIEHVYSGLILQQFGF